MIKKNKKPKEVDMNLYDFQEDLSDITPIPKAMIGSSCERRKHRSY